MIFIGQSLEHSTDMEMVDLSMYVLRTPSFKLVSQQFFIQHSGRIMATYSEPMMVGRPFTSAQYPNLLTSRLLFLKTLL